jgi:alpha-beta hydrolase superfamily lysophospholipase
MLPYQGVPSGAGAYRKAFAVVETLWTRNVPDGGFDVPPAERLKEMEFEVDGLTLRGTLHLPPNRRPPLVIGSHGLLSSAASPKQIALAEACTRRRMAYLRFDHRGCGRSEGRFETVTSLEARCLDLIQACRSAQAHYPLGEPLGLFGSSFGGTVCLASAARLNPDCLATYAAPVRSRQLAAHQEAVADPSAVPSRLPDRFTFDIGACLPGIDRILIIHGDADAVVPLSHAREILHAAGPLKQLVVQPGGDHPMSNPLHQKAFIRTTAEWFWSYLSGPSRSGP